MRASGMKTLYECLLNYDVTLLRAIAERRGVELSTDPEHNRAQELAGALLKPESVDETLAWLSAEERGLSEGLTLGPRESLLSFF